MAKTIFDYAKTYRKNHPRTSWADCVKAGAKMMKRAGSAPAKKAAAPKKKAAVGNKPAVKKVITRVSKKGAVKITSIGAISNDALTKIRAQLANQETMKKRIAAYQDANRKPGMTANEKALNRKMIARMQDGLKASKQFVTSLKKLV